MQQHYFIDKPHDSEEFFTFKEKVNGIEYQFNSCNDIFSKDSIDYGTKVLITALLERENLSGKILDIGCGYGVIGIVLANSFHQTVFTLSDINKTAVELTRQNVIKNRIRNIENVLESDGYQSIEGKFDAIVTNPPIKAGKQNLLNILVGAKDRLNHNGKLYFVIKKKHGEESIKKNLTEEYANVEIIKRNKGYYILKAEKQ